MKETIRVLHGADLHLDSPFEGLSESKAALRRQEQRALLGRIADIVKEKEADIVLLSGDLLDTGSAYRETAAVLCRTLGDMAVPVFIAPGNHDYYSSRSPWAKLELPENVHVFRENRITSVTLPELDTEVFGAAFTEEACPPLLRDFVPGENPENHIRLMCIHGEVGSGEGKYDPITEKEIARSGMNYVALGHSHACSGIKWAGDAFYAWPGCAEGRGYDETGRKGVLLSEVSRGKCHTAFIPVAGREYHRFDVDITDSPDVLGTVLSALPETAERDCFRITLTGETEFAPETERLRRALEEKVFALRLKDETRPKKDIWADENADSLRGEFLRRMKAKLGAAAEDAEREKLYLALRFGLAAMENGEEPRT